jgi:hypothetical protein
MLKVDVYILQNYNIDVRAEDFGNIGQFSRLESTFALFSFITFLHV